MQKYMLVALICLHYLLIEGQPTGVLTDAPFYVEECSKKWTMPLDMVGEKSYYMGTFFKANWFKAAQYCRYHGWHLASIASQDESDNLKKHIENSGLTNENFWSSGVDMNQEGKFIWMANGRPVKYTNWEKGQPNTNQPGQEDCILLTKGGMKWHDYPCSHEYYFICEVQPN